MTSTPARPDNDRFGLVGTTVAEKYAVDGVIGEGGYGVVYSARHLLLGQPVAIKCMKPLGTSKADMARATSLFLREAQVLFKMTHPGIVRLYDVGTLGAQFFEVPYAVLERVEGRSLDEEVTERAASSRPFSRDELRRLFVGVLEALAFTHDAGIAHRDLKPSNIMLVPGPDGFRTKVLDFGIARFVANDSKHSSGLSGFTPAYAAPEQWSEGFGEPGPATDVFALALTFAEACTLRSVFEGTLPARIFGRVMVPGRKVDLSCRPDLPRSLQHVIDRALAVQPRDRYADARAMQTEVEAAFATDTARPAQVDLATTVPGGVAPEPLPNVVDDDERMPASRGATVPGPTPFVLASRPAPPIRPAPRVTPRGRRTWLALGLAALGLTLVVGLFAGRAWGRRRAAPAAASVPPPSALPAGPSPSSAVTTLHVTSSALPAGDHYTPGAVAEVVRGSTRSLERCQQTALEDGAPAVTDLHLFVAIQPSGRVLHVLDVDQLDVHGDKRRGWLSLCAATVASSWTFGSHGKEDLSGVLVTLRFRAEAPDERSEAEAKTSTFTAQWVREKPEKNEYPAYDLVLRSRGRLHTLEYSDGSGVCTEYDKRLSCAWFQLDSRGRFGLERRDDGTLRGRWGMNDDDSTLGTIELSPEGASRKKRPRK